MSVPNTRYRLTDLDLDFVSLVPAGDDPMAQVVIAKAAPEESGSGHSNKSTAEAPASSTLSVTTLDMEEHMGTINKSGLDADVLAYIEGLELEVETLSDQVAKAEEDIEKSETENSELRDLLAKAAPNDPAVEEEISKSLLAKADPAVRALIEKQNAELKKQADIAKAEREARLEAVFISKAEELPHFPGDSKGKAALLRSIADSLDPEQAEEVEKALRAMNAKIEQGSLFKSIGTGGAETTISKTVEAKAEELRKADPSLTIEQARVKVYESDAEIAGMIARGEEV